VSSDEFEVTVRATGYVAAVADVADEMELGSHQPLGVGQAHHDVLRKFRPARHRHAEGGEGIFVFGSNPVVLRDERAGSLVLRVDQEVIRVFDCVFEGAVCVQRHTGDLVTPLDVRSTQREAVQNVIQGNSYFEVDGAKTPVKANPYSTKFKALIQHVHVYVN
jgi:hypothetical protein